MIPAWVQLSGQKAFEMWLLHVQNAAKGAMLDYENNQQFRRSVKEEAIKLEVKQGRHSNFIIFKT